MWHAGTSAVRDGPGSMTQHRARRATQLVDGGSDPAVAAAAPEHLAGCQQPEQPEPPHDETRAGGSGHVRSEPPGTRHPGPMMLGMLALVTPEGPHANRASVRGTEPTRFVALIGVDCVTCTGIATAPLVTGVTEPA